ncbi:MAG: methyltransferase domain-containing protein, partial [Thermocrispum sp.]
PGWLELREPADIEARDDTLLEPLRTHLPAGPLVIRDLGCGTGANLRWLSGMLPGPQQWILHDRDPQLLARAAGGAAGAAAAETRLGDFTALRAADLAGTSLVTASAVLDILTGPELARLARAVAAAAVPALFTLTVAGEVDLAPAEPLDAPVAAAFNRHQHRGGRLGPDAATTAADALRAGGCTVHSGRSPWRLGPAHRGLAAQWLRGWCAAAAEEQPGLELDGYLRRRLDTCAAGNLRVIVHHVDLLALPGGVR